MSIQTTLYNLLFKRTSTFALTIMGGAFMFERTIDIIGDSIFESINKGRLWKHIEHKYADK